MLTLNRRSFIATLAVAPLVFIRPQRSGLVLELHPVFGWSARPPDHAPIIGMVSSGDDLIVITDNRRYVVGASELAEWDRLARHVR